MANPKIKAINAQLDKPVGIKAINAQLDKPVGIKAINAQFNLTSFIANGKLFNGLIT